MVISLSHKDFQKFLFPGTGEGADLGELTPGPASYHKRCFLTSAGSDKLISCDVQATHYVSMPGVAATGAEGAEDSHTTLVLHTL